MRARSASTFNALSAAVILLGFSSSTIAADFFVSSADDIETAMETAAPGDSLIMTNGTWTNQEIYFVGLGTAGNPITLRAQTPGGVILNGTSQLLISGDHLVVDGLHFKGGSIENSDHVVQFRGPLGEATNSRFTNSVIESYFNPNDLNDKWHYVSLYGQNNRVDHNRFLDQQNSGPQVVAWLDESNPLSEAHHTIDANHFGDRPQGWENGFEAIRLGLSETSNYDAHILVENNLFERVDGEIEIISSKANDNVFRYNTFRESAGTLTLRHGHRATVEGNFFLGEGREGSGGIRVVGEDHIIVNNYIADVDDEADGAISLASGTTGSDPTGYQPVKNALIAHNTIVNVGGAAITTDWGHGSSGRSVLPQDVTIVRNLISSTAAPLFEGQQGSGYVYADNIAYGASLGIGSRPGIMEVDPQLVLGPDGLWRPSATSPAVDAVSADYVTVDMDGQPRISLFDIGADEASFAQIVRKPLTTSDVGASWFNYEAPDVWPPPVQLPPGPYQVIQAEDFTAITDPDGNGEVWAVVQDSAASGGSVIKAPTVGVSTASSANHDTLALYDISFSEAGDYTAYYLARGFDGSSNSIFTPSGFGIDPTDTDHLSENGVFRWETGDEFSISQSHVGMPLEFRLGRRERGSEIDAIIFHQNGGLTAQQLDTFLANSLPASADFDGDGDVDGHDFLAWQRGDAPGGATPENLQLWQAQYGNPTLVAANSAVPEPNSMCLILGAVLFLVIDRGAMQVSKVSGRYSEI
ncbi:polysaccharide lyase 6 family protein [Bythopirellula goksoeyrii]|nr:polysaccharide lyase 6 family protein [Bythopirellula goksoeyrii]